MGKDSYKWVNQRVRYIIMALKYLSLVKFSHTIFALPFAMVGFFAAIAIGGGELTIKKLILVVAAMVFARNAAMGYNRYADRDIDALNPRTAIREIPSGAIKSKSALIFIILNCVAFIGVTYFINPICFYLSPVALTIILGYSLFKRFSALCHIILGLSLSIAPVGASIAILGEITLFPIIVAGVVLLWTSGFDILYSLQDRVFDRENSLKSIPALLGLKGALIVSAALHLCAISGVYLIGYIFELNYIYYIGASIFSLILIWEHIIVTPKDISRVNLAFATLNGMASLLYASFTIASFYIG